MKCLNQCNIYGILIKMWLIVDWGAVHVCIFDYIIFQKIFLMISESGDVWKISWNLKIMATSVDTSNKNFQNSQNHIVVVFSGSHNIEISADFSDVSWFTDQVPTHKPWKEMSSSLMFIACRKTNLPVHILMTNAQGTPIMAFDQYKATTAHTYWINCRWGGEKGWNEYAANDLNSSWRTFPLKRRVEFEQLIFLTIHQEKYINILWNYLMIR